MIVKVTPQPTYGFDKMLLDINKTRDKIAQAYTHTQRLMNNV